MGGLNENLVPKKEPEVKAAGGKLETVRVHIDTTDGCVHFHDQNFTPRRTVAVPVSIWYRAWQDLQTLQRRTFEFLDPANGTMLSIVAHVDTLDPQQTKAEKQTKVELSMEIMPAVVNDTFKTLAAVSKRKV